MDLHRFSGMEDKRSMAMLVVSEPSTTVLEIKKHSAGGESLQLETKKPLEMTVSLCVIDLPLFLLPLIILASNGSYLCD